MTHINFSLLQSRLKLKMHTFTKRFPTYPVYKMTSLYCVEWDVKLYYTIPSPLRLPITTLGLC